MRRDRFFLILLAVFLTGASAAAAEGSSAPLPWCRSMAGDKELPLPFGIAITYYSHDQGYDLMNVPVNDETLGFLAFMTGRSVEELRAALPGTAVDNSLTEYNIKLDAWLLPFLNLFGIIGTVDGKSTVDLRQYLGQDLVVDYDGIVYGGGVTLAAGIKKFFGSLSATYTDTNLDESDSSVNALVLLPKAGMRISREKSDQAFAFWAGAMYQDVDEHHTGSISLAGLGSISYDVELREESPWNYLAGAVWEISKHFHLDLEAGFGDRDHITSSLTYRF